ncbi:MAG TPA: hypothetical protein VGJ22_12430 [Anaerolineales bacterium]
MKNSSKLLLLGAFTLAVVGAALLLYPGNASASPSIGGEILQAGAPTATAVASQSGQAQTSSIVQEWDRFCVKKIPYTLLALPENASYEIVAPEGIAPSTEPGSRNPNEFSCTTAGIFRGRQVVTCTGPQFWSFTLRVKDGGSSEDFQVGLTGCPIKDSSNYP